MEEVALRTLPGLRFSNKYNLVDNFHLTFGYTLWFRQIFLSFGQLFSQGNTQS